MKKYSILLSAAFGILALASCQVEIYNEMSVAQTGSIPFELKANIDNPSGITKTTLNTGTWAVNWENTDIIYAVTTDKAWGQDYKDDNPGATIAEFAYDNEKGTFSTSMAIADDEHTFNFLYTAGQQKSYHRGGGTTFQLAGTQSFNASDPTANLKTYDALAAQLTETTPATLAGITMKHLFTLMKVTINNELGEAVTVNKYQIQIEGEDLAGIFNVAFDTPGVSIKSGGTDVITVNIANGDIATDGSIDVYFVMAPVTGFTGNVTFTVTDSNDNIYSRTIALSGLTFAAGTYNTASFSLEVAAPLYPTIDISSSDYTTGFETGFTAESTYNNTTVKVDGPDGGQWGSYYGTVSTNDKITDSNSMQMRWYTSASANLGYAESNFYLSNVGFVSFNAKQSGGLKVGLYYKRASDGDWELAQTFTPETSSTKCTYAFVTPIENARIKFGIVLPASAPTSTSKLWIDDIVVKAIAPSYTITIDNGITHGTVSTSPSGSALEGAEVTITATPDDGYVLASLSVTDALSNSVAVSENKFTMPGSNVTVTATFAKLYTVTWSNPSNGTITVKRGTTTLSSGNTVPEGATVTIEVDPADGYALASLKYNDGSDHDIMTAKSFTMPSSNVSIAATFEAGGGGSSTTILTFENFTNTSYNISENTFEEDGFTFGYVNAMRNGSNGTPSGWAKNQVIQTKSGGAIYNTTSMGSITNIRVYTVANTNSFTITSGSSKEPTTNSVTRPSTPTGSESITYTKYENKTTTAGQTITANYYDFTITNQPFFKIAPGGSLYIYKIEITYSN